MNTVTVPQHTFEEKRAEIEAWLKANAGEGSVRHGGKDGHIRHWLNGDDWLYYNAWTEGDLGELTHTDTIFVFRSETLATEFALRFA